MFTREGLIDMLRHNIVTVVFTKVNGEERTLKCTLLSEHIPNAPTNNGEVILVNSKNNSGNNIPVWDLDASAWKSFRANSVKSISVG